MELKDVILSTLAEMEDNPSVEKESVVETTPVEEVQEEEIESTNPVHSQSEYLYLNSIRERLLVLFEGFQAPNNTNIEAKVDMTLNFLEYTLATIDARVKSLEKGDI